MSISDPIANALTKIRNALQAKHSLVVLPKSKQILKIVAILKAEGFVEDFITKKSGLREEIHIALKYEAEGKPVINKIDRVSKPGRRVYCGKDEMPAILGGMGLAIISTSKGMMSSRDAQKQGLGGEVICSLY